MSDEYYELIESLGLSSNQTRVFSYACRTMDKYNLVTINQTILAEQHKTYKQSIQRALKALIHMNLIKVKRKGLYMVNPIYICKCQENQQEALIEQFNQLF